jgi:large repetitive protein
MKYLSKTQTTRHPIVLGILTGLMVVSSILTPSTTHTKAVSAVAPRSVGAASPAVAAAQLPDPFAPCSPPAANEIACENSKPGNPESQWDINGAGSANIQGFATDISVNRGEVVQFKVDTNSSNYRLDIYRLGYYGGLGARLIETVQPSALLPQDQPDCITQSSTGLIDCGNWAESASWAVPANATSGIYIAKLVREDGVSGSSHIVFIVRDDSGASDLLFQTSDTTWQAYNSYGGNSLYTGPPVGRAYKVSYNRPFNTREGVTSHDWLFANEYPMLRWLEANGYDVSYFTGIDTDRLGTELLEHRVFLSVGHDEYWSGTQRTNVEAARNAGIHLAFFSGNIMFWKTRWENSLAGPTTPYRTLVCYKETHADAKIDPLPNVWTGTWRDPRFSPPADGGRPENALIGTIFAVNDPAEDDIRVPEAFGKFRFWRNTTVATLAPGQTATVGANTVGYEWDEDLDNGFRPSGLIRLSTNTVNVPSRLQDLGSTYGPGTATHSLTMYRHSSGALVFSAATIRWSWGLDNQHDQAGASIIPPPDVRMRQATVNLFADMGVQPATLQPGLVAASQSTDTQPPITTITSPTAGANVALGSTVNITGTASDTGGGLVAAVSVSVDGGTTWNDATGTSTWSYSWTPAALGPVTIRTRAIDDSGNAQNPPGDVTITVVEPPPPTCPCSLWASGVTPGNPIENDGAPVELGLKFRSDNNGLITGVRFYKGGAANGGTHVGHLWTSTGTLLGAAIFTGETASGWQQALFPTPIAITANTTYVVSYFAPQGNYAGDTNYFISTGVDNAPLHALSNAQAGGNGVYRYGSQGGFPTDTYESSNYWVDVVFVDSGPSPPTVTAVTPAPGATDVSIGSTPAAVFSEALDSASLNESTVQLRDAANNLVPATISYAPSTFTVSLEPQQTLEFGQTYTVMLKGGDSTPYITDAAGAPLASDYTWSFTTAPLLPVLVITGSGNKFTQYYEEILRAEGFNNFNSIDMTRVTDAILAQYDVVILGEIPLTPTQVTMLSDWVTAGGNLIAMRPDKQLATLLGLTATPSVRSDAYLLVNTSQQPGAGIVDQTIQYHGTADLYTLAGATQVATIYSSAILATSNPAVTIRSVGGNGGQAAAFTFDLARSVVYTRQGNPAWAGQERDGVEPLVIRPNDLFFPNYVNLDKVAIPQADELQRLLGNMILFMNADKRPLARFWYLPNKKKAVILMTGDDHGTQAGTESTFDTLIEESPPGCSVDDWECYRATAWLYTNSGLTNSQALAYHNQGFEMGVHVNTGCADWTPNSLDSDFAGDLASFASKYTSIPAQKTNRTHCIAWSDWATQPRVEFKYGIRLDGTYYYWPGSWIQNRPGFMTGSGIPMRYADLDGSIIDVYQAATHLVNENGVTYPAGINSMLDKALGPEGFYGVFGTHYDYSDLFDRQLLNSAKSRQVSLISAQQLLTWLDGRSSSSFGNPTWDGTQLGFSITVGAGAANLYALIPHQTTGGQLSSLTINGAPVSFTVETIKGRSYAVFRAANGNVVATYAP